MSKPTAPPSDDVSTVVELDNGRTFPATPRRIALETSGVMASAWALACLLYRLWDAPLHYPFAYIGGDLNQVLMYVKGLVEGGWIQENQRLGAPFGQFNHDFPRGGETWQMVILKCMALVSDSPGLIVNLYYFIGFGAVAAVTFLVLRHLRFGPLISSLVSLLFTFSSFHFFHNAAHLARSSYINVPLAALLIVWLAQWRQRFLIDPSRAPAIGWRDNLRRRRIVAALALCVFIGGWEAIVTMFTLVLVLTFGVLGAIRWREWRRLVVAGIGCAAIGATFLAVNAQTLIYWAQNGRNRSTANRQLVETELYGLKINRMFLPSDGSRWHVLKGLANKVNYAPPYNLFNSEGGQSLGLLMSVGAVGLIFAVTAGARRRRTTTAGDLRSVADHNALLETASTVAALAILFGVASGFSTFTTLAGLKQVRTWNRIVLFVLFFAGVQLAIWATSVQAWISQRFRSAAAGPVTTAVAVVITMFSLWAGPPIRTPSYEAIKAQAVNDNAFVARINALLPAGSAVMQYPVRRYPEGGHVDDHRDYDHLRAYLADQGGLRWSYGAVGGREIADWQSVLAEGDAQVQLLPAVVGMGFEGLWVDTFAYVAPERALILHQLTQALAPLTPLVSGDQRFQFYDLRPYADRLNLSDAELRQLATTAFGIEPPS